MIRSLKSRLRPAPAPLMSNAEFDAMVLPAFEAVLAPLGFVQRSNRLWLRSADAPIRQTFQIELWKGAAASPSWGVSLDFVPHRTGERFAWHRTEASARPDLSVSDLSKPNSLTMLTDRAGLQDQLVRLSPRAMNEAQRFWEAGRQIDQLPALFDQVEAEIGVTRKGFPFDMRPQLGLAKAFAHRAAGQDGQAKALLEEWIATQARHAPLPVVAVDDLWRRFDSIP